MNSAPSMPEATCPTPTPARPFRQPGPDNPFPGITALEQREGIRITARLSTNEALPLYSEAMTARYGHALLEAARRYPDPSAYALREVLASRLRVGIDELLVDAGADALICLFLRVFADPGSVVLHSFGTYPTVEYFSHALGLVPKPVPYRLHAGAPRADLAALAREARRQRARVVYLANPDNPTGSEHSAQAIEALAHALPNGTLLMLDEAYEAFGSASSTRLLHNTVRLRSFSKAYGLAGARVGYAMAPAPLLALANRARVHYSVGTLSQQLAVQALDDEAHHSLVITATQALKARFMELALSAGMAAYPSAANFVTLPTTDFTRAHALRDRLLANGASVYIGGVNGQVPIVRVSLQPELFMPHVRDLLFRAVEGVL